MDLLLYVDLHSVVFDWLTLVTGVFLISSSFNMSHVQLSLGFECTATFDERWPA